jgi:hypothetical protein
MKKKPKTGQKSPEVVVEVAAPTPDDHKRILQCLIDSSSLDSIVLDEFIVSLKKQRNTTKQYSGTKGGVLIAQMRAARSLFIL